MKNIITCALALLTATLMLIMLPTDAEARIYEDTLRLHILANSDSNEDQGVKLEIRDRILDKYSKELSESGDIEIATSSVNDRLADIKSDVTAWLCELGYDYGAEVSISDEWYDTRVYEGFTLPSGRYTSLQVILGDGDGKNWWCVMYPPLCTDIATEITQSCDMIDYTSEELTLIQGGQYRVKFKFLEILSSAFTKNG